jgi:dipeptidyl aminopeptidase/acylaminoacyl peptidase
LEAGTVEYGGDSWMVSTWTQYIGDRRKDAKKLDAVSPAKNADRIKIPVLLMHGTADSTVRIDQSEIMESALKHAHKKVVFISVKDETHHMQLPETRIRYLTELEKFLKENIGN